MIPHPDDMDGLDSLDRDLVRNLDSNRQNYAPRVDDPATWPLDVLPLTREVKGYLFAELGCLLPERPFVVFLVCCAEPDFLRKLATCDRISYPSAAAMLADGWRID